MKSDWCNICVSVPWRSTKTWRDIKTWLLDNVGPNDYNMLGADPTNYKNRIVCFAWEEDAALFALKWK